AGLLTIKAAEPSGSVISIRDRATRGIGLGGHRLLEVVPVREPIVLGVGLLHTGIDAAQHVITQVAARAASAVVHRYQPPHGRAAIEARWSAHGQRLRV